MHDLEQVLAIEAARAGETTGEATTVLRALPGDTARVAPVRLRSPRRCDPVGAGRASCWSAALIAYFATADREGRRASAATPRGPA